MVIVDSYVLFSVLQGDLSVIVFFIVAYDGR